MRRELIDMEELLWRMRRRSQDLQELRDSIQILWDDDAAREINGRYLNPHQDDAKRISLALNTQHEALEHSQLSVHDADRRQARAKELSLVIQQSLALAVHETRQALVNYDQSLHHAALARELVPQIYQYIQAANTSCGS